MSIGADGAAYRFSINALSAVATRFLQVTVLVWVNQHLLRRIAPQEYSVFPLVISLMYFGDILRNIFTTGLGRFMVEADAQEDPDAISRIVSSIFPFLIVVAFALSFLGGLAAWQMDSLLEIDSAYLSQARIMLLLLVFSLVANVLTAPFVQGGYVCQRFVALNVIELGSEFFRVALLLVLLLGVSTKIMWLVVASTCAGILNLILRVGLTRRLLPGTGFRRNLSSPATAARLIRFGAWTSVQGMTNLISSAAPALLLNRFATPVDVASFHLGKLPEVQIRALVGVAASPAQPALTRIYATQGESALHDLYYRGGRYYLWFTLFLVAPLLAFANQLISLYAGEVYASAAAVIIALLASYPFLWASAMFFQIAHAYGKIRAYYVCDTVVQAITLAAMVYAVVGLQLGAFGAALAIGLVGALLHIGLMWPLGLRLVHGRWSNFFLKTVVPGTLPFLFALLAAYGMSQIVPLTSWVRLGIAASATAFIYLFVLFRFCLDPLDRSLSVKAWGRFRSLFSRFLPGRT